MELLGDRYAVGLFIAVICIGPRSCDGVQKSGLESAPKHRYLKFRKQTSSPQFNNSLIKSILSSSSSSFPPGVVVVVVVVAGGGVGMGVKRKRKPKMNKSTHDWHNE